MNWTLALQRNHEVLLRLVAGLFLVAGMRVGETVEEMPRLKRLAILHILRPAESAYRRVILIAVYVLGVAAPAVRERVSGSRTQRKTKGDGKRRLGFRLIDPRKRFAFQRSKRATGPGPRITLFGSSDPVFDRRDLDAFHNKPEMSAEDDIGVGRLCDRLNALQEALNDLPAQAQRMAALQARMKRRSERRGKPNLAPMRPGMPPGFRKRFGSLAMRV